ncbi:MAG TPA: hypothetical protein ENJ31_13540 [Anaerolineae bacterium]|nr:hypothetical protein [Anaerolineae bacterium]
MPVSQEKNVRVSLVMPQSLRDRLWAEARAEGRSLSNYIRHLLSQHYSKKARPSADRG